MDSQVNVSGNSKSNIEKSAHIIMSNSKAKKGVRRGHSPMHKRVSGYYGSGREFYDDMYLRLGNERIPSSRLLYPVESREGSVYWVLTRSR